MKLIASTIAAVTLSAASAIAAPVYLDETGHYYEYIAGSFDFEEALAAAAASSYEGEQGYLATVTSQAENDLLATLRLDHAWLGGSDAEEDGTWAWITGPEAGTIFLEDGTCLTFCNFAGGQPDNYWGTENSLLMWPNGSWNDTVETSSIGYLVEYGSSVAPVPVPAGLPLLLSALGAGALLRTRRK